MCGILGFWFPTEIDNDYFSGAFNSMSKALSHRGPDNLADGMIMILGLILHTKDFQFLNYHPVVINL